MVKPLDVYLGMELPKERQEAIDAVRAAGGVDDERAEFWDRVSRVQDICDSGGADAYKVARVLGVVSIYMFADGEYGRMMIGDSDINRLVRHLANDAG